MRATSNLRVRPSHHVDFRRRGGTAVRRALQATGEAGETCIRDLRSLADVCLHDGPVGREDGFVPRLRVDLTGATGRFSRMLGAGGRGGRGPALGRTLTASTSRRVVRFRSSPALLENVAVERRTARSAVGVNGNPLAGGRGWEVDRETGLFWLFGGAVGCCPLSP